MKAIITDFSNIKKRKHDNKQKKRNLRKKPLESDTRYDLVEYLKSR